MNDHPRSGARPIVPGSARAISERARFSQAVAVGNLLLCAGQVGWNPAGRGVPSDPAEQFRLAFQSVTDVLAEAGLDWGDVVEMTSYHVDLHEHMATFAAVRNEFVREPWPAWTEIGVAQLGMAELLVEIRVIAAFPQ